MAMRCGALAVAMVLVMGGGARAQDSAAVAWNAGDVVLAERLYAARLARDSADGRALHRLALIFAWSERYDSSLGLFARLLRISPANREAAGDRARVFSWAGRMDSSIAAFEALLARDSADLDARRGLARVTSWDGRLVDAEREWRLALAADPHAVPSLVGLAQTLRWQGRTAAALEVLRTGRALAPDDRDLAGEWKYLAAAVSPRIAPGAWYETDSDGNRISTFTLRGAWRPAPRVEAGVEGYLRRGEWTNGSLGPRQSRGAAGEVSLQLEPGWTVGAGLGWSRADVAGAEPIAQVKASLASPARYRLGGALSYRRAALDATALLIERGVVMGEVALSLRAEPAPGWTAAASLARATLNGTAGNARTLAATTVTRRVARQWTAGLRLRALGFTRDLNDGYFDPGFYGLLEGAIRWRREVGGVTLEAELAPGLQQVGSGGTVRGTVQGRGGASMAVTPGREIGLSAVYSRTGLQSFATGAAGYRYISVSASAAWWF